MCEKTHLGVHGKIYQFQHPRAPWEISHIPAVNIAYVFRKISRDEARYHPLHTLSYLEAL